MRPNVLWVRRQDIKRFLRFAFGKIPLADSRFRWCPIDIDDLFASAWFQAMRDFQRAWYLCLLLRAWENRAMPCHLRNDADELRILAGVSDPRQWRAHCKMVLDRFLVTSDGTYIFNPKLLAVYQRQLAGYEKRRDAGRSGGLAKASNARAMPEQCVALESVSSSGSLDFVSRFTKPSLEQVTAYSVERKSSIDPQNFWNYYEAVGWKVGKNPMKNWKAAFITWERKQAKSNPATPVQYGPCLRHPSSGLTQWGTCWDCYDAKYSSGASA